MDQDIPAGERRPYLLTVRDLQPLAKDGAQRNLQLWRPEGLHDIVVDVQSKRVEAQKQSDRAQVADDRTTILKQGDHKPTGPRLRRRCGDVSIADSVDGLVGKRSEQEEAGDVLMVGIDRTHGSEVLR